MGGTFNYSLSAIAYLECNPFQRALLFIRFNLFTSLSRFVSRLGCIVLGACACVCVYVFVWVCSCACVRAGVARGGGRRPLGQATLTDCYRSIKYNLLLICVFVMNLTTSDSAQLV